MGLLQSEPFPFPDIEKLYLFAINGPYKISWQIAPNYFIGRQKILERRRKKSQLKSQSNKWTGRYRRGLLQSIENDLKRHRWYNLRLCFLHQNFFWNIAMNMIKHIQRLIPACRSLSHRDIYVSVFPSCYLRQNYESCV